MDQRLVYRTVRVTLRLDHNLELQRRRLTDQKVSLQRSHRELGELSNQVQELEKRAARRQRLLAEALPVLEQATEQSVAVGFVPNSLP